MTEQTENQIVLHFPRIASKVVFLDGSELLNVALSSSYPLSNGGFTGTVERFDKGYRADVATAPEWGDVWYEQR